MKIPGYKVHRKIGKGGMATVFLATQESFGRKVALKIIADSAFGSQKLAQRFATEAKIVASFSHPHIVPVYEVGRIEQFHYLSMDYLQGGDLASWIKAGLEPVEAEEIISHIAQALHYAHGKGYIHRDVKPDNILFREDSSPVLTDFGIAQPLSSTTESKKIVVGTPAYMSPEQSQGKTIDARTDLYSLGVMFYQMLTKELPYNANSFRELAIKHIKEPIPKLPFAVNRYQPIINKLLAKTPEQRFQSALEFTKALRNLGDHPHMAEIRTSIADLKLLDDDPLTTGKDFIIEESSYRKLGLAKRYILKCTIRSEEAQHFSVLFSQFTTRLLQWQTNRKKQCGEIQLCVTLDPIMEELITDKIDFIYQNDDTFEFLKSINTRVDLYNLEGKTLKTIKY